MLLHSRIELWTTLCTVLIYPSIKTWITKIELTQRIKTPRTDPGCRKDAKATANRVRIYCISSVNQCCGARTNNSEWWESQDIYIYISQSPLQRQEQNGRSIKKRTAIFLSNRIIGSWPHSRKWQNSSSSRKWHVVTPINWAGLLTKAIGIYSRKREMFMTWLLEVTSATPERVHEYATKKLPVTVPISDKWSLLEAWKSVPSRSAPLEFYLGMSTQLAANSCAVWPWRKRLSWLINFHAVLR